MTYFEWKVKDQQQTCNFCLLITDGDQQSDRQKCKSPGTECHTLAGLGPLAHIS